MEFKGTKGNWELKKRGDYYHLNGEGWTKFARVVRRVNCVKSEEGKANAKLIAAAPDLLEALVSIIECDIESANEHDDLHIRIYKEDIDKARKAIEKALK